MAEVKDILMRLRADTRDAEQAVKRTQVSFTELNQTLEVGKKAFGFVSGAISDTFQALDRAQSIKTVSAGFESLQARAGLLASDSLQKLRVATQGLTADFDLMQQANYAVLLGLDPSQLDTMAAAATKLGAAVGRDATEAFNDLAIGVGRQSKLILDNLGVIVDAEGAYQRFAAANNTTAEALSETQKKIAFQEEAFRKIKEAADALPEPIRNAADAAKQTQTSFQNLTDSFVTTLSENESLTGSFRDLADTLKNVDLTPLANGLAELIALIVDAAGEVSNFVTDLQSFALPMQTVASGVAKITESEIKHAKTQEELNGLLEKYDSRLEKAKEQLEKSSGAQGVLNEGLVDAYLKTEAARGQIQGYEAAIRKTYEAQLLGTNVVKTNTRALEDNGAANQKLTDKVKKAREEFEKFKQELAIDTLSSQLDKAIESLDQVEFSKLSNELKEAIKTSIVSGFSEQIDLGVISQAQAGELAEQIAGEKLQEKAEEFGEKMRDSFQESVSFFEDIFQNAITGTTFNLEDTLKRIAVGFASQIAASLSAPFLAGSGINLSGGASGLGQSIASAIGFGGAGFGAAAGATTASGLPVAAGYSAAGLPIAAGYGGAGALGGAGLAFAGAGVAGAGLLGYGVMQDIQKKRFGLASQVALALPTGGLSFLGGGLLGGGASQDELNRRAIREQLGPDLSIGLFGGGKSRALKDINFADFDPSSGGGLGGKAASLVSPLANVLGGGGKAGEDFEKIFAQIVTGFEDGKTAAENYNQVYANTLTLMEKLGVDAQQAKDDLSALFLDGKVSLEEYGAGLQSLNQLAQENLAGKGSIAEAVQLMGESFDNPRNQLKAFQLLITEAKELGINDFGSLANYMGQKFGPEAKKVFDKIGASGAVNFNDIKSVGADAIYLIVSELENLRDEFQVSFEDGSAAAAKATEKNLQKIASDLRGLTENARKAGDAIRGIPAAPAPNNNALSDGAR